MSKDALINLKILVLTPRFPFPIEKGDKLRIYHQIVELSKNNEVILCAITDTDVDVEHLTEMKKYCSKTFILKRNKWLIFKNLMLSLFSELPFQSAYFFDKNLRKKLYKVIQEEKPDHLFCQLIRIAEYIRHLPISKTIDYMDTFSVIAQKWSQRAAFPFNMILKWEAKKVAAYEAKIFPDFDHHIIISKQDRAQLNFPKKNEIHILPNGVNLDFFQPKKSIPKKYDLVFVGNMGYHPNVAAALYLAKEIFPKLLKKKPHLKLLIAGARPSEEVKSLQNEQIEISGWVEDIRDAYASASVFVAPISLGSGLQNKILEALAMGIPCVTTSQVNGSIEAPPETTILVADDAEKFTEQIIKLLDNPLLQTKLQKNGLAFVKQHFNWEETGIQLNSIINSKIPLSNE